MQETELPEDPATNTSPVSHAISGIKPSSAAATELKDDDTANKAEESDTPTDETQPEANADEAEVDEAEVDEANADEANADEAEVDEVEVDEADADSVASDDSDE